MGAKTFPVYWKEADLVDPSVRNFVMAPVGQFFISIRMFEEDTACHQIRKDFAAKKSIKKIGSRICPIRARIRFCQKFFKTPVSLNNPGVYC
jgi:hypothetical protein